MKIIFARAAVMSLFVAAAGCGGDGTSGGAQVSVPNVVSDSQAAATTAITGAGLALGTVTTQSSSTVASGSVISQDPVAGASVAGGSDVSLVVSSGPAAVAVPNVVGDTKAAATTAITGAGLTVGTITDQTSATVASGDVISENPVAGTSVSNASSVALVISTGPAAAGYTIGGTVIGLAASTTVHVLNGADSLAISANGSFTLPTAVATGATYSVSVGTPTSAQTCSVQNATGTIASAKVTNVVVYCTHNVSNASLNNTYAAVVADFDAPGTGVTGILDGIGSAVYNGDGVVDVTSTYNISGTIAAGTKQSETYAISTTNAVPNLTGTGGENGGIEGVNGDAIVGIGTASGTPPSIGVEVLPDATATTDSVNGKYTQVTITAQLSTGDIQAGEGNITLSNGAVTGTLTYNTSGTITTGNQVTGQFTVASGVVTVVGNGAGAVSTDRDLIVVADTNSGDNPYIAVQVPQGSGVTQASFAGVYSVSEYGGASVTATFGRAITLSAYGNGSFVMVFTKNANGAITTDNDSGTYTAAADGTLTLTDSEGSVYNGGLSEDGNTLVLANIASKETPAIWVGVRQ